MQLDWRPARGTYSVGIELWLGQVPVGHVHYNALRSRSDPVSYVAVCSLPGLKAVDQNFPTEDDAKAKVVSAVKFWISAAGLEAAEKSE